MWQSIVVREALFISCQNPNLLPVNEVTGTVLMMPNVVKGDLKKLILCQVVYLPKFSKW